MRVFRIALLTALIVVATVLIAAAIVKKQYSVERRITINKPRQEVFNYVKLLKNQDHFSKWASMDPGMKKEYRGTDGMPGFVSSWVSDKKNVGTGEQEITRVVEGERIEYVIRFLKPFKSTSPAYMTTDSISENETSVRWGFSGRMDYPMNLMLVFMNMEKMVGSDFDTGLQNLKRVLEGGA